jgi:lipopolysaccharide/colanic/teichoic acid biosynthesis glycosyltransferase
MTTYFESADALPPHPLSPPAASSTLRTPRLDRPASPADSGVLPPVQTSPGPVVTDSWLIAWTVGRSGFPAIVSLGSQTAAFPERALATGPEYALHLTCALPIPTLLQALSALRGKRSPRAVLLVADPPHPRATAYREQLHLGDEQQVLSIRRSFRKRHRVEPHPALVGIVWKLVDDEITPRAPLAGCPWRSVRALFAQSRFGIFRHVVPEETYAAVVHASPESARSRLLAQLTPASLRALAADLGYKPVHPGRADFCFAHPDSLVDDAALLRGPLFIDRGTTVAADHVHVGPGWVTPDSPAVTLPEESPPADDAGFFGSPELPNLAARHASGSYFIGPAARRTPVYDAAKRAFDIAFSLLALFITLPICLVAALAIKLYDRGPVFFAHKRESVHGKPFGCLKFRTMVRNAEAMKKKLREANQVDGPQFKIARDPRITPIGQLLRKTNIDELPQFINVLMGDMSVVGPRPSPFEENQLCPAWREARLSVKPGITGLWQVSRSRDRGAADFQEWIYYDTQYVERRSFILDMRIILLTIKEMLGQGQ